MSTASISEQQRPISAQQRSWLSGELEYWQSSGLIDALQADRIQGCYELASSSHERQQSIARFTLQGIAALFIGLALLLFIGYNWAALHWVAKLALVFGSVIATHVAAYYLRTATIHQRGSEILFFLGCLFYGAGIWLVAQVFHLDSHYPDGVWWWAIGVLPFALCLDTLLLHALLVGLLALWAGMEVINFPHLSSPWFNWWPNAAWTLPLLAAPGLVWAYRKQSPLAVALYVGLMAWWIVLQAMAWDLSYSAVFLIGVLGAGYLILAELHRVGSRFATPFRVFGILLLGGALIPSSYYDFNREMHTHWHRASGQAEIAQLMLILAVVALLAALIYLFRPEGDSRRPLKRVTQLVHTSWVPIGLLALTIVMALSNCFSGTEVPVTVLANFAMVTFAIWLIQTGLHDDRGWVFFAGVAYFLLWSVLRYFDLFSDVGGMLGAAGMFLLCGLTLFALTILWGKRRSLHHV